MADIADMAQDIIEQEAERTLAKARTPFTLAAGEPGECEYCGKASGRLIDGICAPCRDAYGLP